MSAPEAATVIDAAAPALRRSRQARLVWGDQVLTLGGDAPVRVQAMTNTDTVDAIGTAIQVKELVQAGSELVRITVNTPEAAAAVPKIRDHLATMGVDVPLIEARRALQMLARDGRIQSRSLPGGTLIWHAAPARA